MRKISVLFLKWLFWIFIPFFTSYEEPSTPKELYIYKYRKLIWFWGLAFLLMGIAALFSHEWVISVVCGSVYLLCGCGYRNKEFLSLEREHPPLSWVTVRSQAASPTGA